MLAIWCRNLTASISQFILIPLCQRCLRCLLPQNSELQLSWRMICSKGETKFNHIQIDSGTFQADKNLLIKAINVDNWNKIVWLSGLFCAIIRANLLTFHFILGKFGANNRVVWLSMVWLSGLCCTVIIYDGQQAKKSSQHIWGDDDLIELRFCGGIKFGSLRQRFV